MKRNLYIWHQWIGIAACLILFAWSFSGFLHPIMSWTQPRPVQMFYKTDALTADKIGVSPSDALRQNNIENFSRFNTVSFGGESFYQIEPSKNAPLVYLNSKTGAKLDDGDAKFAEHLARYYTGDDKSKIREIKYLTEFSDNYNWTNRLLPAYEIKFDRPDKMTAYIETSGARLATMNNSRKVFIQSIFVNLHNLEILNLSQPFGIAVKMIFMSIVFFTALSGVLVYGLFWKRFKPLNGNPTTRKSLRKWHRTIGIFISLGALSISFSGAFHAFEKRNNDITKVVQTENTFSANQIKTSLTDALSKAENPTVAALVKIDQTPFYRIVQADKKIVFVNAETSETESNGELKLARSIANSLSGFTEKDIVSVEPIKTFTDEYGFINKRLPVVKVQYDRDSDARYYVETSSGTLAAKVDNLNAIEGYSFGFLHKWDILGSIIGKTTRDILLMVFAFGNMIVTVLGVWLFVLGRKNKLGIS